MRATDGLQTTITLGPVHRDDQAFSLQLSLEMSLPMPSQDEHLPDQIEAFVHQAGLEDPAPALPSPDREGRPRTGPPAPARQSRRRHPAAGDTTLHLQDDLRRGHRSAVADQPQSRRHASRSPRRPPGTHPTNSPSPENLRDAVCDQMSDRSAGKSRADVCQYAGDEDLLGRSTVIDIVHQEGEQLIRAARARPRGPGRSVRGPVGLARPRCCRPRRPDRVSR